MRVIWERTAEWWADALDPPMWHYRYMAATSGLGPRTMLEFYSRETLPHIITTTIHELEKGIPSDAPRDVCIKCVEMMWYWNQHAATRTLVNDAVVQQPVNIQELCAELARGGSVVMNTRRMNLAVTTIDGIPYCVFCAVERNQPVYYGGRYPRRESQSVIHGPVSAYPETINVPVMCGRCGGEHRLSHCTATAEDD